MNFFVSKKKKAETRCYFHIILQCKSNLFSVNEQDV